MWSSMLSNNNAIQPEKAIGELITYFLWRGVEGGGGPTIKSILAKYTERTWIPSIIKQHMETNPCTPARTIDNGRIYSIHVCSQQVLWTVYYVYMYDSDGFRCWNILVYVWMLHHNIYDAYLKRGVNLNSKDFKCDTENKPVNVISLKVSSVQGAFSNFSSKQRWLRRQLCCVGVTVTPSIVDAASCKSKKPFWLDQCHRRKAHFQSIERDFWNKVTSSNILSWLFGHVILTPTV